MVRGVGFGWARTLRRGRRAKITPGGENADDIVLGSLAPWLLGSLAPWLLRFHFRKEGRIGRRLNYSACREPSRFLV